MKTRGFTLLESVASLLIIGIVIAATVFAFVAARMWAHTARNHYQAITIAKNTLENIIQSYKEGSIPAPGSSVITVDNGMQFTRGWSYPDDTIVDVTVSWTERAWAQTTREETLVLFYKAE